MMAVPTFTMGCLPSYEQVGWISTALLVLCRLLQGLSVGGQLPSSLIFTVERQPREHWGYYGSLVVFASGMGVLLGNFVGAIMRSVLTDEQLLAWAWRIPFLSGIVIGFVALLIQVKSAEINPNEGFYNIPDTNDDEQEAQPQTLSKSKHPITESFRSHNLAPLLASALVPMLPCANYYVTFVWMAVYMEEILDPPVKGAFWINACASFFGHTIPSVYTGYLSDKYDRVTMMFVGTVLTAVIAPFLLWVISMGKSVPAFFAQATIGLITSLIAGPMPAWVGEAFPPEVRLTGGGIGYNVAVCISSGFSPLLATALVNRFGPVAPGIIYPLFALCSTIGLIIGKTNNEQGTANAGHEPIRDEDNSANVALIGSATTALS